MIKRNNKTDIPAKKNRWIVRLIPIGLFLILVVFSLIRAYLYGPEMSEKQTIEVATSTNINKPNYLPVKDGEIVQEFALSRGELTKFVLMFDNFSPDDSATLIVTLEDRKGNEYYRYECPTMAFGDGGNFYLVGAPEKKLKSNRIYAFHIRLDSPESELTVRTFHKYFAHKKAKTLTVNGVIQEGVVYIGQTYEQTNDYLRQWMVMFFFTLVFCALLLFVPSKWPSIIWEYISPLVLCIAGYSILQLLDCGKISGVLPKYVKLNLMLLLGMILLIKCIAGRFATYISGLLLLILGITDYYVILFKGESFLLTDLKAFSTTMEVAGNYHFIVSPLVMTCILMVLCIFLVQLSSDIRFFGGREKTDKKKGGKAKGRRIVPVLISRLIFLMVGMILFLYVFYNKLNVKFDFYRLETSIAKDGYGYSNLCILQALNVKKPSSYSDDEIERILSEITEPDLKEGKIRPRNLIVIMNESLSDLRIIGDFQTDKEYLPFINSMEKNTIKGNLYVSTFGGGTCLTEYEFLTGNTKVFFPTGLKPYFHACFEPAEEGITRTLQAQGYHTVAMHPSLSTNWNRNVVYPLMGFEEFHDIEDFDGYDTMRKYISDKGNYDYIIDYVKNYDSEEDLFIFNVTMQNHGGYDITENMPDETVKITNLEGDYPFVENYLELIKQSDSAFEYLISYFSTVEEPTMIVLFGDHLPQLSSEFFDEVYGKMERTAEERNLQDETFYVIWTNYDSDFEEKEEISANYLGSYMLNCAGLEMTDYNRFLLSQMKEVPAVGLQGYRMADGRFIEYGSKEDTELKDYEILQYFRVYDRREKYYDIFRLNKE